MRTRTEIELDNERERRKVAEREALKAMDRANVAEQRMARMVKAIRAAEPFLSEFAAAGNKHAPKVLRQLRYAIRWVKSKPAT